MNVRLNETCCIKSFECSNRLERYYIRTTPLIYPKHCHISGCCLDFDWAIAHCGFHDCKLSKSFGFKTSPNQYPSTTVLDSWHEVFVLYVVFVFFAKCGLGTLWSWQTFQTRHAFYKSLTFNMLTEAGSIWDAALKFFCNFSEHFLVWPCGKFTGTSIPGEAACVRICLNALNQQTAKTVQIYLISSTCLLIPM